MKLGKLHVFFSNVLFDHVSSSEFLQPCQTLSVWSSVDLLVCMFFKIYLDLKSYIVHQALASMLHNIFHNKHTRR